MRVSAWLQVGWKKDFVDNSVPFLPISGWIGDNLIKASEKMTWWKPVEIKSLSGKAVQARACKIISVCVCVFFSSLSLAWVPRFASRRVSSALSGARARLQVTTLLDYLNLVVELPERDTAKPLRVPISGIYKIKGVGDVLAGRVEQGSVKPNDEVRFMPTHTTANKCEGKARSPPLPLACCAAAS